MTDTPKPRPRRKKDSPPSKYGPGNKNPSPDTRFGGPRGNKPGATAATHVARHKAAELAAIAQEGWLSAVVKQIEQSKELPDDVLKTLRADTLRLVQDALDREHGKAVSAVEVTSPDGSASMPSVIRLVGPGDE